MTLAINGRKKIEISYFVMMLLGCWLHSYNDFLFNLR
jgi:hypothetical protein